MKASLLILAFLGVLLLAGCGATPSTLSTMTPIPRTPRPTATATATPTPTGTPVPSPTPGFPAGDLTIYDVTALGSGYNCDQLKAGYPAAPYVDTFTVNDGTITKTLQVCVWSAPMPVHLDDLAAATGWSEAYIWEWYCRAGTCDTTGWLHNASGEYCAPIALTHSHDLMLFPRHLDTGTWHNEYLFLLFAGGTTFGDCSGSASISYSLSMAPSRAGPTPTPAAGCAITEVYTRYGTACRDYNLRGGCGTDDEYIEIECTPAQSLAGWQLAASDVLTYTLKADNMTGPLKVFWLDQWPTWTVTRTLPLTGTATLINAAGTTVDTRTWQTIPGYSWGAVNWTNPAGPWWYFAPSPGY